MEGYKESFSERVAVAHWVYCVFHLFANVSDLRYDIRRWDASGAFNDGYVLCAFWYIEKDRL